MIGALLTALALLPQTQEPDVFVTTTVAATEVRAQHVVVAADKRQIDCLTALRELSRSMNWNLVVESTPLENDLRFASIDLNLAEQDPRMVAQLIAVAGGADSIFDEPAGFEGARVTLHVVRVPSGATRSGRQRLRALAGQWYRSFLREDLQNELLVEEHGVNVRMHLGQLLVDSGDVESAVGFFRDAYESRPHDRVAAALLKVAECHLDLAAGHVDRERRLEQYGLAEEWVRRVFEGASSAPEVTPAIVLLGKAMLGQARNQGDLQLTRVRARQTQDELQARAIKLIDSVELLDVWLLTGEAQRLMERPERAYQTMVTLLASPYFDDLDRQQLLDYHFLRGYGALGTGKPELAMCSLEWFLIYAEEDERRGAAYVMLAESYLAQGRYVEGRAASVEARNRHIGPTSPWYERTCKVWARTALALGEKEEAFGELERIVLRGEEPQLTLFLVDELLADRQWQRAMSAARPLTEQEGPLGDQARYKTVLALYEQSIAGDHLDDFPAQAIALAPKVKDQELRSKIATMIGEAYTELEMLEHAADAFRGILR